LEAAVQAVEAGQEEAAVVADLPEAVVVAGASWRATRE
jgi:hypothetical protein